jgi:uncharacterized membrane protein
MSIDVAQLRAKGVYASKTPLSALITDLGEIEQTCRKWKAYRTRVRWICAGLVVVGPLSLILGNETPAIVLFGIFAIIAAIVGFVHAYKYARPVLVHADRCGMVRGLLEIFRDDTDPKSPLSVKMSLADQRVLLKQYEWTQRKKGKQSFFQEDWLTVENEFLDGTSVTESVSDLVRERSYVNPRGKSKKKVRTRHLVNLRLRYPASLYGDASAMPQKLQDGIKTPSTATVRSVRVSDGDIKLKATVNSTTDLTKTCAMLLLGAYRILNLSRKVAARQGSAKGGVQ